MSSHAARNDQEALSRRVVEVQPLVRGSCPWCQGAALELSFETEPAGGERARARARLTGRR